MKNVKKLAALVLLAIFVISSSASAFATSFTFTAAGDYGTGSAATANYNLIKTTNPNFHVALGDFAYGGSPTSWSNSIKSILGTSFPFQIIAGNHDAYNGASQWNGYVTGLPSKITLPTPPSSVCQFADPDPFAGGSPVCQQYGVQYYFDYPVATPIARVINISPGGNVFNWHYTVNTNHYKWTAAAIDDARAKGIPWVFVTMHENCITTATKSCAFSSGIEPDLMNLLISKKVDIVLQGHDHTYQRSKQLSCASVGSYNSSCVVGAGNTYTKGLGTTFVINGLAGVSQYAINTGDSENGYFQAWNSSSYGIVKLTVSDNPLQLTGTYVPSSGSFTDTFTIQGSGVPTSTIGPSPTPTRTPTPQTSTNTPTRTPSLSPTRTSTLTPTRTPTFTATRTPGTTGSNPSPTSPQSITCTADINGDNKVDLTDYSILVQNFLKSPPPNPKADINKNGIVDLTDYSLLVSQFLKPCAPNTSVTSTISQSSLTPTRTPTLTPSRTPTPVVSATSGQPQSGVSYYVGCDANASDSNSGTSPTSAWATLTKANSFTGQNIILQRGCTWNNQRLTVSRSGSPNNNLYVDSLSSYSTGSGALPIIQRNSDGPNILLTGSYITVQNLKLRGIPPSTTQCTYNSVSETLAVGHVTGVDIESGAFNNTVQNIDGSGFYAAVWIKSNSHDNKILRNNLSDNLMLSSGLSAGAFGVLIHGHNNEIAYNTINGNDACSPSYGRDGAAVELYGSGGTIGASNNIIHHNFSTNTDSFAELGKTSSAKSENNTFAYNQYVYNSSHNHGIFIVTRGSGDSYGPIPGTKLYNNTAYMTGNFKQGIVCYAGCDSSILKMRNNIIQKAAAMYSDRPIDENYNMFVGTVNLGGASKGANSLQSTNTSFAGFTNISNNNFSLTSGSPAINSGTTDNGGFNSDLSNPARSVPSGSGVDMGAYEF